MSSHEEPGMAAEPEEDEIISNNSEYASRESSGLLDSSVPAANHGDDSGEPSHPATVIIYPVKILHAQWCCSWWCYCPMFLEVGGFL